MTVKSSLMVLLAGTSLMVATGCTTKNYVRKQTQPIVDKSNELDARTAKNNAAIHDVDSRATAGIAGANTKAGEADQKALDARGRADQAQTLATQANTRADALANQVANLDNYRPVAETSVHFAFNKADLTPKAKTALDQLLAEVPNTKGYLVVVEGDTDSVGSAKYNYQLSERRADSVVQYLSSKSIPAHKIYLIGMGKDKYAAENSTADGRAKNRRVEVRLMTNVQGAEHQALRRVPLLTRAGSLSSPGTLRRNRGRQIFLAAFGFSLYSRLDLRCKIPRAIRSSLRILAMKYRSYIFTVLLCLAALALPSQRAVAQDTPDDKPHIQPRSTPTPTPSPTPSPTPKPASKSPLTNMNIRPFPATLREPSLRLRLIQAIRSMNARPFRVMRRGPTSPRQKEATKPMNGLPSQATLRAAIRQEAALPVKVPAAIHRSTLMLRPRKSLRRRKKTSPFCNPGTRIRLPRTWRLASTISS